MFHDGGVWKADGAGRRKPVLMRVGIWQRVCVSGLTEHSHETVIEVFMSRRRIEWILLIACILAGFCCKTADDSPWTPPVPQPVTLHFDVLTSMRAGVLRTVQKEAMTLTALTLSAAEFAVPDTTDHLVVRKPNFGDRVAYGKGQVVITPGAGETHYEVYLLDRFERADLYDKINLGMNPIAGGEEIKRFTLWSREDRDGLTGPESVWVFVFNQMNDALQFPYRVGGCAVGTPSDARYGFAQQEGGDGGKKEKYIYINPENLQNSDIPMKRTAGEELWEYLCGTNNPDDRPARMTIYFPQSATPTPVLAHLLRAKYICSGAR